MLKLDFVTKSLKKLKGTKIFELFWPKLLGGKSENRDCNWILSRLYNFPKNGRLLPKGFQFYSVASEFCVYGNNDILKQTYLRSDNKITYKV